MGDYGWCRTDCCLWRGSGILVDCGAAEGFFPEFEELGSAEQTATTRLEAAKSNTNKQMSTPTLSAVTLAEPSLAEDAVNLAIAENVAARSAHKAVLKPFDLRIQVKLITILFC